MCLLKFNSLSMVSRSNSTSSDSSIVKVYTESFWGWYDFLLSIMNWNFSGFAFVKLISNQYKSLLASCVRFSNIVFKFAPQEYKVLSSAKLKIVDFPMTKRKSFKNICKHSGISIKWTLYKVDISVDWQLIQERKVFTVKLLWKNLYTADNYKADSRKTNTFFVPQMNILPKNNLYKADTGKKNNFHVKRRW